jgi:L-threonylcarbamoyladenylate synthase
LKGGGVGVFTTDTVYGLGGRADKLSVIRKIYRLKKRDKNKPLLILVSSVAMAKRYVKINKKQELLLKKYWSAQAYGGADKSGALTAVLEDKKILPKELSNNTGKIGVRLPDNKFLLNIIKKLQVPLIATSANISGQRSALDVKNIKVKADFIVDGGKLLKSKESTVVDLTGEEIKILRQGDLKIKVII